MEDVLKDFFNVGLFFTVTVAGTGASFSLQQKNSVTYKPVKITELKNAVTPLFMFFNPPSPIVGSTRQPSSDMYLLFRETCHSTETPGDTRVG